MIERKINELVEYLELQKKYQEYEPDRMQIAAYGLKSRFFSEGKEVVIIYYDAFEPPEKALKSQYKGEKMKEKRIWRKNSDGYDYEVIE